MPHTSPSSSSPTAPKPRFRFILLYFILSAFLLTLAHLLDSTAYHHLAYPSINQTLPGWLFRIAGDLRTWLLFSLFYLLHLHFKSKKTTLSTPLWFNPTLLLLIPALNGLAAEILKLLLRRERPILHNAAYVFRPFDFSSLHNLLSTSNLGLPSSHSLVAFAAAFLLIRLHPPLRLLWLTLATGCSLTRVLSQAHFLSDVTLAALVAYPLTRFLHQLALSLLPPPSTSPPTSSSPNTK